MGSIIKVNQITYLKVKNMNYLYFLKEQAYKTILLATVYGIGTYGIVCVINSENPFRFIIIFAVTYVVFRALCEYCMYLRKN